MSVGAGLRSAVAVLLTAAAVGLVALAAVPPAQAAACAGTSGVTVVVEFGALGGGTDVDCSPDGGGRTADRLLKDAGHALTYVQRFPGFVCRIDGAPADDPCVNTPPGDAYWGLWWSDGKNGKWSYSSLGAGSLSIPAGGYVAMVWDDASGDVRPRTDPTPHAQPSPTPTPTKKPTPQAPTATPAQSPTSAGTSGEPTSEPSPTPSKTQKPKPTKTSLPTATPESSDAATQPAPDETDQQTDQQTGAGAPIDDPIDPQSATGDAGLPPWVAPVVVVVLLGAAGAVAMTRRRRQP